ncbi:GNAT family N-acetyltransferase [Actinomadura sp. 6N118]|uniref:GNAT family N-acetyltransferase n=1 Tax=Actinomadura sp. 6N118 TaxID=3375151 RepID=UPI0037A14F37
MTNDDLHAAERAAAVTFLDADRRADEPEPEPPTAADSRRWTDLIGFLLSVDPNGCWVAEHADEIVGFAVSQNRERLWFLVTYGVLPGWQGKGIGKHLMDAVLSHADGRPGLFSSTVHPAATRRYRLAGFTLYPRCGWLAGSTVRPFLRSAGSGTARAATSNGWTGLTTACAARAMAPTTST